MGVDELGRLYWDGKPVEVSKVFSLTWWQMAFAVLTLVAALLAGGAAALSAYVAWQQWQHGPTVGLRR